MKTNADIQDEITIKRYLRHIVVLINTLLSLATLDYSCRLMYRLYQFLF